MENRFLGMLIILLFSSCVPRPETKNSHEMVSDVLGRNLNINVKPGRIVSLNPAVTEILFAIGAGEKLVGVTEYCDYPPEAKERSSVGGFSGATVSVEQILALKSDLVFLSADMHGRIISLLDDLNIPSFAVEPRNFSQVYETISLLGEITGCVNGAGEVIAEMKQKIAEAGERISGRERPAVFWLLGEDPLMTAGKETFVSEAIKLGGGENIFEDVEGQWPLVSPEQVLLRKPEWILYGSDMGGAIALDKSPFWQNIPAVREGRAVVVNADFLYRYGPRLADGVISISRILHPDL
jgi:iron complex transport system substrate-binding protein